MRDWSDDSIAELRQYPATATIYGARLMQPVTLYREYDLSETSYPALEMEQGDDVLVTVDHDGTGRVHFMSLTPRQFHYLAPVPDVPGHVEIVKEL